MVRKEILSTIMLLVEGPNTRVLVNHKLPTEILTLIFDYVRLQPRKRDTPGTSIWDPVVVRVDWLVRASHVCRHWRAIIVDTPALWDRIDDPQRRLDHVRVPAERARILPLTLSMKGEPTRPMNALLQSNKPIRELRYYGITIKLSQKYLQQSAYLLESLSLTGTPGRTTTGHARRPSGGYPVQVFRGHTPSLRRLSLDSLNWIPTLQTSTLTHLYLADCYGRKLLQRILSLLSASPNLTDLVLVDRGDVLHHEDPQGNALVHLRHLRRLVLKHMSSAGVKRFISHIRLNPETCVRLIGVLPLDGDLLNQLSRLPLNAGATKLMIKGSGTRRTVVYEGQSSGILIDHFTSLGEDWGTALPRMLAMDQLRELHVVLRDSPALFASTPTTLFDFLHRAPALENLYVDTQGLASLLDALECCRSKPPKLACPNVVLHVQMPCRGPGSDSTSLIQSFAARQTNLGIRHLVAEYCPGCGAGARRRPWFSREIQVNFESVTSMSNPRLGRDWRMFRVDWPAC
ncbi:uncharacterized protein B0H18DRAFT_516171 [Fomitopsis serialis]|uniref:uncharacterized protein n=1 Tax=Fomitopsis serialis TaxID=139415 RepID=UPI0020085705|nr:uncharacterized protein B0H18DRAFT_516171 [Neoantrodia serialis]KAH9910163.1 hypothetical protein B0H18DRAFT_516171 [Neoantrodia serialis]